MRTIVTTSWDDGAQFDLRVAEILAERRLPGTFYIPVNSHHRSPRMSLAELLELDGQGFEIGAHGVTHLNLPDCNNKQLTIEVESCKKRLEDDLAKSVRMFAYPQGRHNGRVVAAIKQAGYSGARTTAMMARDIKFDRFRMPTSVHVFPHSRLDYLRNLTRVWGARRTWVYATLLRRADTWIEFGKLMFDAVLRDGGMWHLYGHSWEIEEMGLWDGLKEILDYVSNRPGVMYLANGPIVDMQVENAGAADCARPAGRETPTEVYKETW